MDINALTIKYMANSLYKEEYIEKPLPTKEDYKFYKQRILNLTKNMLKKKYPNERLKKIHLEYVNELIEYLKFEDFNDLIQEEYNEMEEDDIKNIKDNFNLDDSNKLIMQEKDVSNNLDDFVIKKCKIKEKKELPLIKKLDIKTEQHKIKGLKSKIDQKILL